MSGILRRRPSPAMIVALIALFISMGGVSYGLATGSVDSREIKNNTIRSKDVKNNNLRGRDIRTGTVRSSDVGDDSVTGADVLESSLATVPSATNATNATNASTAGKLGRVTVQREDFAVADNTANGAVASCPAGQQALAGGVITGANDSYITNSVPVVSLIGELNDGDTFTGWRGFVVNQMGGSGTITSTVYVVCAG